MPRASIDLGSNSVLLTVLGDDDAVLHDEARVVGLGKGLGDGGSFRPDRREAALEALIAYAARAMELGVPAGQVIALATSASRRATDASAFFAEVEQRSGLRFQVIGGDEEARLTWIGGISGLTLEGRVVVVDLGGGSTELAVGDREGLAWKHSFEVGSVRLTEAVLGDPARTAEPGDLAELRDRVRAVFAGEPIVGVAGRVTVVGVAGSVTTLAAAAQGLTAYDGSRVHGTSLTDAELADFQERLIGADAPARRRIFAVSPDRADFLLAGATVLREVLRRVGAEAMTVSDRGLRYGALDPGALANHGKRDANR